MRRLFRNRYNPGSGWTSFGDFIANLQETYYCWIHRVPPGAQIQWRNGRVVGHTTPRRW
jgi:hypothetical protein